MMGTWKRVLKGYTPLSNPQDISLDFPGATRGSSPAPSPISPLQILKNICIYTVAPVALLWLFYFPKDASDAINGNPYACYANGQMVKGTSLYGYCSSLPTDTTSQHDRVEIGLDRHLTEDQCDTFFPDLYKSVVALFYLVMQFSYGWRDREVDRAESHWRQRGGISRADLNKARDESSATVVIQSNRLYIEEYKGGINSRTKAILGAINEAVITATEPIPDIEFSVKTSDSGDTNEEMPIWVMSRTDGEQEYVWMVPDFGFYSWPEPGMGSFQEVSDQTLDYERRQSWSDKLPKLFWRGAFMVDIRRTLASVSRKYGWGDVDEIHWNNLKPGDLRTPAEHCGYKFLAHVEGSAYSGRLKYLLQCRSVIVAHPMKYTQHFHHLMNSDPSSPEQNIVITENRDWTDLPEAMHELLTDDDKAKRIADHSYEFWRYYLSSASINCYWRRMFHAYASSLNTPVKRSEHAPSYASFNLMGKTRWDPS